MRKRNVRLNLFLNEDEKEIIIKNAKKNRMNITQYIVHMCVVSIELPDIEWIKS